MSEAFDGTVEVQDGSGNTTVLLDGNRGALNVGADDQDGTIQVNDVAGIGRIFLDAAASIVALTGGRNALHLDSIKAAIFMGAEGNEGAAQFPASRTAAPSAQGRA